MLCYIQAIVWQCVQMIIMHIKRLMDMLPNAVFAPFGQFTQYPGLLSHVVCVSCSE